MIEKIRIYSIYAAIGISLLMIITSGSVLAASKFYLKAVNAHDFIGGTIPEYVSGTALNLVFVLTLTSFLAVFIFKSLFKKSSSPEVFFILVAVAALSLEGLRAVIYLSYFYGWMYRIYLVLPRVIYFGKLISALALFISGLFSTGFPVQKQNIFLGLSFIFSILLSSSVPIDYSINANILLPGNKTPYVIQKVIYGLYILSVLNYFAAAYINKNKYFFIIGLGTVLFALGMELVFPLTGGIYLIVGFFCLGTGLTLIHYTFNKIYHWI